MLEWRVQLQPLQDAASVSMFKKVGARSCSSFFLEIVRSRLDIVCVAMTANILFTNDT